MMPNLFHVSNDEELQKLGARIARLIDMGTVVYLIGPLGAGKTTFTRGFLRALGYSGKVKSPTFTLVEPYELSKHQVFHFDLYRLEKADELEQIGIRDYFTREAICLVEWPEKGFPLLPEPDLACYIAFAEEGRDIRLEARTERGADLLKKLYS